MAGILMFIFLAGVSAIFTGMVDTLFKGTNTYNLLADGAGILLMATPFIINIIRRRICFGE